MPEEGLEPPDTRIVIPPRFGSAAPFCGGLGDTNGVRSARRAANGRRAKPHRGRVSARRHDCVVGAPCTGRPRCACARRSRPTARTDQPMTWSHGSPARIRGPGSAGHVRRSFELGIARGLERRAVLRRPREHDDDLFARLRPQVTADIAPSPRPIASGPSRILRTRRNSRAGRRLEAHETLRTNTVHRRLGHGRRRSRASAEQSLSRRAGL